MNEETALIQSVESSPSLSSGASLQEVIAIMKVVDQALEQVLKEGIDADYATIPGTPKPTLLQPGAEKLGAIFGLASPNLDIEKVDLPGGHREVTVKASIAQLRSGRVVAQGVGCCTTLESRYRYRVAPRKATDNPVPSKYWELRKSDPWAAQELLGGKGFSTVKVDGQWMIAEGTDEKVEHDNPADYWNTILKIAAKRAYVSAIKTATASSGRFSVDLEDTVGAHPHQHPPEEKKTPPRATQEQQWVEMEKPVATIWKGCKIKDVTKHTSKAGNRYFKVILEDGRTPATMKEELANELAGLQGTADLEVKEGRFAGSWEVIGYQLPLEGELNVVDELVASLERIRMIAGHTEEEE